MMLSLLALSLILPTAPVSPRTDVPVASPSPAIAPLVVTHPNGRERFDPGDTVTITWQSETPRDLVRLALSTDGGQSWSAINDRASGGAYRWIVPSATTGAALIRAERWRPEGAIDARPLTPMSGIIKSAQFTPDGRRIVIAEIRPGHPTDSEIYVYNATTLAKVSGRVFRGRFISDVAVAPDSRTMYLAVLENRANDTSVVVLNVETAAVVAGLRGHAGGAVAIDAARAGDIIVTGGFDKTVKIWNTTTYGVDTTLEGFEGSVSQVALDPTGTYLATGTTTNEGVRVFTTGTWTQRRAFVADSLSRMHGPISDLEFSYDGLRLLAVTANNDIVVFDVEAGREALRRDMLPGTMHAAYSPDGRSIASGRDSVEVWDASTGATLFSLAQSLRVLSHVSFAPDGGALLLTGRDNIPRVWTLTGSTLETDLSDRTFGIGAAASTRDATSGAFEVGSVRYSADGSRMTIPVVAPPGEVLQVHLVDMVGRVLVRKSETMTSARSPLVIDISHVQRGAYVIAVRCGKSSRSTIVLRP